MSEPPLRAIPTDILLLICAVDAVVTEPEILAGADDDVSVDEDLFWRRVSARMHHLRAVADKLEPAEGWDGSNG
jgi:hypothetical protein